MSLSNIAQTLAAERWPCAIVDIGYFSKRRKRCIACASRGENETLALAVGHTDEQAWRALARVILTDDTSLTTEEVAQVLGISARRIRTMAAQKRLVPSMLGRKGGITARYTPESVWQYLIRHTARYLT